MYQVVEVGTAIKNKKARKRKTGLRPKTGNNSNSITLDRTATSPHRRSVILDPIAVVELAGRKETPLDTVLDQLDQSENIDDSVHHAQPALVMRLLQHCKATAVADHNIRGMCRLP